MALKVGKVYEITLDEDKIFTSSVQFDIEGRKGILRVESLDSSPDSMSEIFSGGNRIMVKVTDIPDNPGNFVECRLISESEEAVTVNSEEETAEKEEVSTPEKHNKPEKHKEPVPKKYGIDWEIHDGFFEDEIPKSDLFDKFAEAIAKKANGNLSTNQIRNFYDAIKSIENRINQSWDKDKREIQFKHQHPFIKMIKSRVAHASGRKNIPDVFRDFMNDSIDKIEDYEDFKVFVLLFEAITGWHSKYKK